MANKTCDGICYPPMISKEKWRMAKMVGFYKDDENKKIWKLDLKKGRFL